MPEEMHYNRLIDEELNRATDYPDGANWHLKQTLINRGVYVKVLEEFSRIPHNQLRGESLYVRIAPEDIKTVRGVVRQVVQEAFANLQ